MKDLEYLPRQYIESLPKLTSPAGYVYVIQEMKYLEDFKIGRTNYPARRVSRFEVLLPFEIKPVLVMKSSQASAAEAILHKRFKKKHVNGEWYKLSESDLQTISELNLDQIVNTQRKSVANAKRRRHRSRRRKGIKDSGWSLEDWSEEEEAEEGWSDDDPEIDRDIDYDNWESEETYEPSWASESSDVYLPEGDIEETIESEILSGKNLAGVILNAKDLSNRNVSFANLWGAELSYAQFVNSNLTAIDLTDASMNGADLEGADLAGGNLTGADLTGANLIGANLKGANMTAAILSYANMARTLFDETTILPDGQTWTSKTDLARFTN